MQAIVYLGYLLFEVPSNLFLKRIGSGNTFAHITITGIASMLVKTPMMSSHRSFFHQTRYRAAAVRSSGATKGDQRPEERRVGKEC